MSETDPMHAEYQRQFQELHREISNAHEEISRLVTRVTDLERITARLDGRPVPVPIRRPHAHPGCICVGCENWDWANPTEQIARRT